MSYQKPYKQLVAALIAWGLDPTKIVVGGGFPRDVAHGTEPKDLDIVLVGGFPDNIEHMTLEEMLPGGWSITKVDESYDPAVAGGDFDQRLDKVVQLSYRGPSLYDFTTGKEECVKLEADILVATPQYHSTTQHVLDNDFNLNHYVILPLHFINDEPPLYIGDKPEGVLVQCRTAQVTYERHNRMVEKAKAFGWHANIPYKEHVA